MALLIGVRRHDIDYKLISLKNHGRISPPTSAEIGQIVRNARAVDIVAMKVVQFSKCSLKNCIREESIGFMKVDYCFESQANQ